MSQPNRLTTELGLFNLEANSSPLDFTGDCFRKLENELNEILSLVKKAAKNFDADFVLTGILPIHEKNVGCLPIVKNKKLVGLLTAQDFLTVSTKLFEERLQNL